MKKTLCLLFAMFAMALSIMAGVTASCKISGSQDNATVVASITEVGDGYVMVELDNDGTFAVNVTVKISSAGHGFGSRACKVSPQMSTAIKVPVSQAKAEYNTSAYNVTVSGARCN